MSRRYIFADESGDFVFNSSGTKYLGIGTLLIEEDELARLRSTMGRLRDELAWVNHGLNSTFHASEDSVAVRKVVFQVLRDRAFRVDVTLLEKTKAQPRLRGNDPTSYQHAWYYHLNYLAPRVLQPGDQVLIVAASYGTKKTRKAFRAAIEDVMTQCIHFRVKRTLAFWRGDSDFALQAVDYCLWAATRKWESGDASYYEMIADKIKTQFDLWAWGQTRYY